VNVQRYGNNEQRFRFPIALCEAVRKGGFSGRQPVLGCNLAPVNVGCCGRSVGLSMAGRAANAAAARTVAHAPRVCTVALWLRPRGPPIWGALRWLQGKRGEPIAEE